ncbi:LysE family translocator [Curvibacter sp. APW13]|uniref:LysE family translocator n=1 Tax=Curvibacter sp. APW13 TaxID=3077236 RepID=UPI0028E02640|nr:LysE family translocator [Curvibacter sp. APW13]MDT8993055.1 LysE family translocator [Curvibacter sp. APW13]
MNTDTLIAASLFALASYITPGPNNTMILSSGVRFGLRRSIPHLLGICLGFAFMLVAVGLGLHTLLHDHPAVLTAMRWVGAAWMLYLAWQLATSTGGLSAAGETEKPMTFLGASAFQWVNPKAWVMAVTAMSTYLPPDAGWLGTLQLAAVQTVVGSPCVLVWAGFGSAMRQWLQDPLRLRIFNIAMALALVASLYPLFT